MNKMPKVLFVCIGNTERSQMAEAYYNYFTRSHDAESAGLRDARSYQPRPTKDIVDIMNEEHIDVSKQAVKPITPEMVEKADSVYVLCGMADILEEKIDCLLSNPKVEYIPVPNPHLAPMAFKRKVRDMIRDYVIDIVHEARK